MQNHLVCSGCRSILLSPRGATNVCCAICNTLSSVPPPGTEMAQLVCGGCRALLMYGRSSISVRCSCCNTINIARPGGVIIKVNLLLFLCSHHQIRLECIQRRCNHQGQLTLVPVLTSPNRVAHVSCGQCLTVLVYPYGAASVKCAVCRYVTNIGMDSMRVPIPVPQRPDEVTPAPPSSAPGPKVQNVTVIVENPMSPDGSGKLVSNLVVRVTTVKK